MKSIVAVAAVCAALVGCSPNIQNKEAVKKGVIEYFKSNNSKIGLNLDQMAIDVVDVAFHDKQATATVAFRAKNAPTNDAAMQLKYQLEQKGDKWVVKGKTGADIHAPAAEGQPPMPVPETGMPATPPMPPGANMPKAGALPPGHPPAGAATPKGGSLPPGHPPVDPKAKP